MRIGFPLTAVFCLSSVLAEAGPRVTIAPMRGKAGAECAERIADAIADSAEVVPWTQVKTGASFSTFDELSSWLEKQSGNIGADVIVLGTVLNTSVVLEAYGVTHRSLLGLEKVYTRGGCRLSARGLNRIVQWIGHISAKRAPPPPPPEPPPEPPPPEPEELDPFDGIPEEVEPPPPPPPLLAPPVVPTPTDSATVAPIVVAPPRRAKRRPLLIEAELELGIHRRTLGFSGVQTTNLRSFDIGAMPVPGIAVRVFFLRQLGAPWMDAVFFKTKFARAAFISARRSDGGPSHAATHDRFEGRFGYRIRLPAKVPVMVSPSIGLHVMRFSLDTAENGAPELDLPAVSYVSPYLGADVEAAIADKTMLILSGAFLPVLSGGPILDAGYFPNGSATGVSIEAGVRYAVHRRINVTVMGDYLGYALKLNVSPGATRIAATGQDTVLGIRLGARVLF